MIRNDTVLMLAMLVPAGMTLAMALVMAACAWYEPDRVERILRLAFAAAVFMLFALMMCAAIETGYPGMISMG